MPPIPSTQQTALVSLISKHVQLQESRKILKGNCPFHEDNAESFMVYPAKDLFKCFGCGLEGGTQEFSQALSGRKKDRL